MLTECRGKDMLKTRRRVLDIVQDNPGLHLRELSRKLEIPLSTVNYHLQVLEDDGILSSFVQSGYKRYFRKRSALGFDGTALSEKDRKALSFLRQRIPFFVIRYLLIEGGSRLRDIVKSLGLPASTVHYHVSKMVEEDVLKSSPSGTQKSYRLSDREHIKDLYLFHRHSFEDEVDEFIDIWASLR